MKKGAEEGGDARLKCVDGYTDLANAIIVQAVKDYEKTFRKLRRNPDNRMAKEDLRELESFFFSEWYRVLTDLEASYLLRKVRETTEKEESE